MITFVFFFEPIVKCITQTHFRLIYILFILFFFSPTHAYTQIMHNSPEKYYNIIKFKHFYIRMYTFDLCPLSYTRDKPVIRYWKRKSHFHEYRWYQIT